MKNSTLLLAVIFITGMALTAGAAKRLNGVQPEETENGRILPNGQMELTEIHSDKSITLPSQTDFTLQKEMPAVFSNGSSFSVATQKVEYREPNLNLGTPGMRGAASDSQAFRRKQTKKKLIVGAVLNAALVTVVTSMMNSSGNHVKVGAAGI
jgi:hypothetical protein